MEQSSKIAKQELQIDTAELFTIIFYFSRVYDACQNTFMKIIFDERYPLDIRPRQITFYSSYSSQFHI